MVVDHDSWPLEGRLGKCTSGEYSGCFILVTAERNGYWLGYVADPPTVPRAKARCDDFVIDPNLQLVIDELGIEWLPAEDDLRLEREVFGLRDHWRAEGLL